MAFENPFVLPKEQYKRNLNIVAGYIRQCALFLAVQTGDPYEKCVQFVKNAIKPGGKFALQDPEVLALEQVSPGNREKVNKTFLGYVGEVVNANRILSPSMVGYERPEVNKSTSAAFVEMGIKARKMAKNEMFQAKIAKNHVLEYIKDCEQNSKKIGINSISGMHGFAGNILYVRSGHSSLTSMCRTATGYGNAWNEKFLEGSRHYYNPEITLASILAIVDNTDYERFQEVVDKYQIHLPDVQQTMDCIHHSTTLYWRSPNESAKLESFVAKLSPLQRAAFVYTGDMYHLAQYNDELTRTFLTKLITARQNRPEMEAAEAIIKGLDSDVTALVNYLNADIMKGTDHKEVKAENPDGYRELAATALGVYDVLAEYFDLIRTLWVPSILSGSVARIPSIIRRVVLGSDTDSSIFTTQYWVKWLTGSYKRSKLGDGAWYAMTYLATQGIIHVLAQLSANVGVTVEDLHRLAMKNEYAFPVFVLTPRAKHYFAFMSCREGNVFDEYDNEIKGVALRPSKIPVDIVKRAQALMMELMEKADNDELISLDYVYGVIYEYEQKIRTSIENAEQTYFETGQIKEKYKNMESSPFQHYLLWEEVFAPKYGNTAPPTYASIKVPIEINSKSDMRLWFESMEDKEVAARFAKFMDDRGKDKLTALRLPSAVLGDSKMPVEILQVINIRRLTYQLLECFYILLECLGIFQVDDQHIRLVSDFYQPS